MESGSSQQLQESAAGCSGANCENGVDAGDGDADGDAESEPPSLHIQDQLSNFRMQWKQELKKKDEDNVTDDKSRKEKEEECTLTKAKEFFRKGVRFEQGHCYADAICFYRQAIQLVPDIDVRMADEFSEKYREEAGNENAGDTSDNIDHNGNEEELQLVSEVDAICWPVSNTKWRHISELPTDVLVTIIRWVVTSNMDVRALEQLALVCKAFYHLSRDAAIWRLVCQRTWGASCCGSPGATYAHNWRTMYVQRPHVLSNGCYISKTTYLRYGEKGMDNFYRPWFSVEYYRLLRFFPDGTVLMLTTPETPYVSVYKLRRRYVGKKMSVLAGNYKLSGDLVTAVVQKPRKPQPQRYRRHNNLLNNDDGQDDVLEQSFHIELEVRNLGRRKHAQLCWINYQIHFLRRSGEKVVSKFDILPSTFPPFKFSRVKSYALNCGKPL